MSGPELPNLNPQPQDSEPTPAPGDPPSISSDPLLKSGAFIDPQRYDSGAETPNTKQDAPEKPVDFGPGVVIAAQPISMFIPDESSAGTTPKPAARRRNPEEMAKRPSWLPEDWKIDLRVRTSGASAGLIDPYYVEPSGQRKFRSKNEVLHFLETGSKLKRKLTSDAGATPSSTPGSRQKSKKSSGKRKKTDTDPKTPESKSVGKSAKPGGKRKKAGAVNPKTTEPPQVDPKTTEPEQVDPQTTEPSQVDTKTTESEQVDTKTTESEQVDTKTTESDQVNPKTTEAEPFDPKTTEPPQVDGNSSR